ncbi:MAG: multidrug effflux MFS transporter [Desulfobulbus sp.]
MPITPLPQQQPRHASSVNLLKFTIVFAALSAFAPLATDMYLASFPLLAKSLHTDIGKVSLGLSIYFFGLSMGQLIYGPLIDRFGRKPPLLIGIALFALSSGLIVVASSIQAFLVLRLLQAIGGCAGMVVSRAMISDLLDEREAARFFSLMMVIAGIGPIVAPILGGYLISFAGWQSIFVFLTLLGGTCLIATQVMIPETLPPGNRQHLGPAALFRTFGRLLHRRAFMIPTLIGAIISASIFTFISGAPFVYMQMYGVSKEHFGWVFGMNAIGIMAAALTNRVLLRRFSTSTLLTTCLTIHILFALLLFLFARTLSLPLLVAFIWLCLAGIPVITANSTAMAMAACGQERGSGSAIIGVLQFALASLASAGVGFLHNGTIFPMVGIILACSLLGGLVYIVNRFLLPKRRSPIKTESP